jgi:hypothetical protein
MMEILAHVIARLQDEAAPLAKVPVNDGTTGAAGDAGPLTRRGLVVHEQALPGTRQRARVYRGRDH